MPPHFKDIAALSCVFTISNMISFHICDVTSLLHFVDHVAHCTGCAKNKTILYLRYVIT